jgi:hypothetical protein
MPLLPTRQPIRNIYDTVRLRAKRKGSTLSYGFFTTRLRLLPWFKAFSLDSCGTLIKPSLRARQELAESSGMPGWIGDSLVTAGFGSVLG